MIKIRLHGQPEEVARFSRILREMARVGVVRILQESEDYPDRGASVYVRRYLELEQLVDVDVTLDSPGKSITPAGGKPSAPRREE